MGKTSAAVKSKYNKRVYAVVTAGAIPKEKGELFKELVRRNGDSINKVVEAAIDSYISKHSGMVNTDADKNHRLSSIGTSVIDRYTAMKEYTVTYCLKPNQVAVLKAVADKNATSVAYEFGLMMSAGAWHDIDKKIAFWSKGR